VAPRQRWQPRHPAAASRRAFRLRRSGRKGVASFGSGDSAMRGLWPFVPPSDAAEAFDALAGRLDYPMLIVTVHDGRERAGCLVGFGTQCSVDPPRFLVCLSKNNRTFRVAEGAEDLGVHVVPDDGDDLVELFGGETGDDTAKFERWEWRSGPRGVPVLEGCPAWFAGSVLDRHDCGDHVAFLLEPFAAEAGGGGQFSSLRAMQVEPGHEA
jgi:flavin reductase (DIM6/NTAB) family NADH-FMN oxidoreductase RutF